MYWVIGVLVVSVWMGGLLALGLPSSKHGFFKEALVFAGSFLFGLILVHMLPELFAHMATEEGYRQLGVFMLLGFIAQLSIELLSGGVEHGHCHTHATRISPWLFIGLCIHSLTDGLAVAMPSSVVCSHHAEETLWGIALHKICAGFALATLLRQHKHAFFYLLLFSLTSPLGVVIGHYMQTLGWETVIWQRLYAFLIGGLLHIGMAILIEAAPDHRLHYKRALALLAGTFLAIWIG